MKSINDNTCHQYKKKMENAESDKVLLDLNNFQQLSLDDLDFEVIAKNDKEKIFDIKVFIEKYEWLGKINNYWNYSFSLSFKGNIVCVVMVGTPMMFSNLLGEQTKSIEQTILRGASSSIAPKNSGSFLITKALKWMVKNTPYRVFSGYSTTHEAFEYGYIYQSLSAILVSDKAGTRLEYLKPDTNNQWLSDRHLRKLSNYKKQAQNLGIIWEKTWNDKWRILWDHIPRELGALIKQQVKEDMKNLTFRKVPPKLRYVLIKGEDKRETKKLLNLFKENNPKLVNQDGSLGLSYHKKNHLCKKVAIKNVGVENERL